MYVVLHTYVRLEIYIHSLSLTRVILYIWAAPESSPRRSAPQPSPPRQQNDQSRNNENYDPEQVGRTRRDSLGIFLLPSTATEREIKVQYRRLARIYHPDKYDPMTNEMSKMEAQEHFKLINNAYEFLRT